MTSPRASAPSAMLAALALAGAAGAAHAQDAASLLYERTLMSRADARCHLFSPEIAAALAAAGAQARGAALRGGASTQAVRQTEARAELKAYAVACTSPDLATAAARVRKAFDGYAALRTMSFPGALGAWQADRKPWPLVVGGKVQPGPRWRLSQTTRDGAVTIGLTGGPGIAVVATWPGAASASGARLILRDPTRAEDAVLDPRRTDLQGRTPPSSVTRTFFAQAIGPAPLSLLPQGARAGALIAFPAEAANALAALDPREAFTVELIFPSRAGDRTEDAAIEVGDFAAARAFLAAGR